MSIEVEIQEICPPNYARKDVSQNMHDAESLVISESIHSNEIDNNDTRITAETQIYSEIVKCEGVQTPNDKHEEILVPLVEKMVAEKNEKSEDGETSDIGEKMQHNLKVLLFPFNFKRISNIWQTHNVVNVINIFFF